MSDGLSQVSNYVLTKCYQNMFLSRISSIFKAGHLMFQLSIVSFLVAFRVNLSICCLGYVHFPLLFDWSFFNSLCLVELSRQ